MFTYFYFFVNICLTQLIIYKINAYNFYKTLAKMIFSHHSHCHALLYHLFYVIVQKAHILFKINK